MVIDLAHRLGEIAVVFEKLGQGDDSGHRLPKIGAEIPRLRGIGPRAGEQAGAGGQADGLLAVGVVEDHAALGQAVDVGGFDHGIAIAA